MEIDVKIIEDLEIAITKAFDNPELKRIVQYSQGVKLIELADGKNFPDTVYSLVTNENTNITKLIFKAVEYNPKNEHLQNFVHKHIKYFLGCSESHIQKEFIISLLKILYEISNFDFQSVIDSFKSSLPTKATLSEKIKFHLKDTKVSSCVKIYLILTFLLNDYPYLEDRQVLRIFFFVNNLLANISDRQLQQELKNWQDRARDQGYQLPKEKSSSTNNENKDPCTWQPYLSIVIKKLSSPDSDRYSLLGYLILENINNRNQKPDLIPLQNYIVVNNRKTDDNTTIPNYKSSKQFNFSFSQSKTEAGKKNLAKQLKMLIEESYDKIRGIRERRIRKNLIIEFFLPGNYLFENVDRWKIPYGIGCGEFIELGKKYNVIVRSYDRLNSSEFITILEQNWQKIEKIIDCLQDDINEQELIKYHQTYYTNLNSMSGRGQKIATKMKSKIGLKLICKPPKSGESCSGLVNAILESGVPIIIWAKCQDIPDQNLFNKLNQFFAPKSIKKINNLANIVYEQRVKAFEAIDTLKNNQIEEEIKDIEKDSATEPDPNEYFGYYLTIYFEETNRLSKLHDYLKDNIQNNKLRLGA
ncbi:MAG: hypothetical protein QNJ32_12670 [Xenococcaceae cyanobacterium MO_167.B27]|nr:hypothetical protein [Xenococcaceae cyanobacterium MO_167.B27]